MSNIYDCDINTHEYLQDSDSILEYVCELGLTEHTTGWGKWSHLQLCLVFPAASVEGVACGLVLQLTELASAWGQPENIGSEQRKESSELGANHDKM